MDIIHLDIFLVFTERVKTPTMEESTVAGNMSPRNQPRKILGLSLSSLRSKDGSAKQDEEEHEPFMGVAKFSSSWLNRDQGVFALRMSNSSKRVFGIALTIINVILFCLTTFFLLLINRSQRISSSPFVNSSPYHEPELNAALKQLSSYCE